jgi:CBS domain-containing protein
VAKLSEIMSTKVFSAPPQTPVSEAARSMVEGRFGSAVVLDGAWLVGIFTERDVLRAAASGADLTQSPLSEWMTPDPVTASPEMDTDEATQIMAAQGFRHLPVVDGDTVTGMVSLRDLLRARIGRRAAPSA